MTRQAKDNAREAGGCGDNGNPEPCHRAVTTGNVVDPSTAAGGSVVLRGVTIALDSEVGKTFIIDCCRNLEGLLGDGEIKSKYELRDEDWKRLADNGLLLRAVRAERERRIHNGEAARDAAQRHFARAPSILNSILTDEQIAPRHRIEAARELRQVATGGGDAPTGPRETFKIVIDLGADMQLVKEFTPSDPPLSDDGEAS